MSTRRLWQFVTLTLPLFGLACLSPNEPPTIQYYSALTAPASDTPAAPAEDAQRELWVRRVSSAEHLKLRLVWSRDGVEYGFRELVRWTEDPSEYVRKSLEDQLYPGLFRRSDSAGASTLEVNLRAFEERRGAEPVALVVLHVQLRDMDGNGLLEQLVQGETAIEGDDPAGIARAMASSLAAATAEAVQALDQAAR